MPTVTMFVVMQVRQAPQQALRAGVRSAFLFRSGRARVWARSSIDLSVGPRRARREPPRAHCPDGSWSWYCAVRAGAARAGSGDIRVMSRRIWTRLFETVAKSP